MIFRPSDLVASELDRPDHLALTAGDAGQTDDLDNVPSTIDHTVDYVMHNRDGFVDAVTSTGEIVELGDRTPGGLWPSDHAAVVVTMHIAKP